ncbi:hypothetical protein Q8A73_000101 [Channa argus]|nr:hypothetical protein Q8A73_000101 [Channa argus]
MSFCLLVSLQRGFQSVKGPRAFLTPTGGLTLCKPAVCCCHWVGRGSSLRVSEDEPLHYSSLRHPVKPRPRAEGRTGLVRNDAIYSAVNCLKTSDESRAQIRVDSRVSLTS